ncbi:MAG: hypothetical protein AB7W16_00505 [Candidatus Obscuribacterales bacterium]
MQDDQKASNQKIPQRARLELRMPVVLILIVLAFLSGTLLSPFLASGLTSITRTIRGESGEQYSAGEKALLIREAKNLTITRIRTEIGSASEAASQAQKALNTASRRKVPELELCQIASALKAVCYHGTPTSVEKLYKQYESILEKHPELFSEDNKDNLIIAAYINLTAGDSAQSHRNYSTADERYKRADGLAGKIEQNEDWLTAYVSDRKGLCFLRQDKYSEALAEYKKTLDFVEKHGETSYGGQKKLDILYTLCTLALRLSLFDDQVKYAKQGLAVLSSSKDETRRFYKHMFTMMLNKDAEIRQFHHPD